MKRTSLVAAILLALSGCARELTPKDEQDQAKEKVVVVARQDDIVVYKVRDVTPGGASYVYFTSKGEVAVSGR